MCSVLKRQGYGEGRLCSVVIFTSVGRRKGEEGKGLALILDLAKLLLQEGGGTPKIACTTSTSGVFFTCFLMMQLCESNLIGSAQTPAKKQNKELS